jgi:hypothetical protein
MELLRIYSCVSVLHRVLPPFVVPCSNDHDFIITHRVRTSKLCRDLEEVLATRGDVMATNDKRFFQVVPSVLVVSVASS